MLICLLLIKYFKIIFANKRTTEVGSLPVDLMRGTLVKLGLELTKASKVSNYAFKFSS
jgi:hypothetical protein